MPGYTGEDIAANIAGSYFIICLGDHNIGNNYLPLNRRNILFTGQAHLSPAIHAIGESSWLALQGCPDRRRRATGAASIR